MGELFIFPELQAIASIHVISRPCFHIITSQNIPGSPVPFASLSRESLGTRLGGGGGHGDPM